MMLENSLIKLLKNKASKVLIKYFLKNGFENEDDVKRFIGLFKGNVIISTRVNCGRNHKSQFQFLSDVLLGRVQDCIVWANRSGSKSFLAGFIAWVKASMYKKNEFNILGGSFEQSQKSYKAMNNFWDYTGLENELLKDPPLISETRWKNGSKVHILTASEKSVRGGHPQNLILDEVDEMDREIFEASLSQPQSKHGIKSSINIFSTNHKFGGTMDFALQMANERGGFKLYKWCIWDTLESCKDYKCSTCPLSRYCPGKQMKEANGYYKIDDFIKKLSQLSEYVLQIEWFCHKVGRSDLVYGNEFDYDLHMVDIEFNPSKDVYLSIDWGGSNPFSIGVWQNFDELGWVRVDEIYQGHTTNSKILKEAKNRRWWKNIRGGVADPSRNDLFQEWEQEGIILEKANNDVEAGIEAVRNALKPVKGNPKIYFSKKCQDIVREFKSYTEKNGKPVKENDHAMDEMRYFVMWKVTDTFYDRVKIKTGDWDTSPDDL